MKVTHYKNKSGGTRRVVNRAEVEISKEWEVITEEDYNVIVEANHEIIDSE